MRLGEIWLNFGGGRPFENGNSVASFVGVGSNADPGSVGNAIDNNINTFTRLGSTVTESRRRITIGFASSSVPAGPALFIEDVEVREGGGATDLFIARINQGLVISNVMLDGKNLLVTNSGFDRGAKILLYGQQQKTANDAQNPTTILIGKKAGKKIARGQTVTLQVRNSDGTFSNEFSFTRPAG